MTLELYFLSYENMSSTNHPLSQGDGYGVVLGFGAAFALGMIATTFCLQRYHNESTRI